MYVGVILFMLALRATLESIPHVCGGDPKIAMTVLEGIGYSPCMWG